MNQTTNQQISPDGIVLLAKQPGLTSFSSLYNIKKALNTTKVGHTGTLDSFAQGLLVVCTGRMTKLAGNITEFDKSYKAVIKFGEETDTLELTGNVIRTAPFPKKSDLENAVKKFTGNLMQQPPAFSAIHVNGKRSSDLARQGKTTEIPSRPVSVYKAEILDMKNCDGTFPLSENDNIQYALISFTVSKGTYIRSLARDIAAECGSAGHLIGLYRTRVGNFNVEDAAAFSLLKEFTIDSEISNFELKKIEGNDRSHDDEIKNEILNKKQNMSKEVASDCGFITLDLVDENAFDNFKNGKPLKNKLFIQDLYEIETDKTCAVFFDDYFSGLIYKNSEGRISYKFVNN